MAVWTCPDCRRKFGAAGQGHMCQPGLTVVEFIDVSPGFAGPVFERVLEHLVAVDDQHDDGNLIVDPLAKKVLFKNGPTFCVLDVKTKWVAVGFSLRRRLESGRLSRKVADYGSKFFHVVNVDDPELIDDEFRGWLTEAYVRAGSGGDEPTQGAAGGGDPMVPDDVDFVIAPPPM